MPYHDTYERIRNLIKQCDNMALKYNPIVPFRQTYKAPAWILQEEFSMGLHMNDNLQVDLMENNFFGRILVAKNLSSQMAKFFDLDLMEAKNDVFVGKGKKPVVNPQNCLLTTTDVSRHSILQQRRKILLYNRRKLQTSYKTC